MDEITKGTVVRYCKPITLDGEKPTPSSFQLRVPIQEKELSVHLLDYFNKPSEKEQIAEVKKWQEERPKPFVFKSSGLFATLDIQDSQKYVCNKVSERILYVKLGLPHCGISHTYNDLVISELLLQCVKNIYPVKEV